MNFHLTAPLIRSIVYGKVYNTLPVKANIPKFFSSLCTSLLCKFTYSDYAISTPLMNGDP